MQHLAPNNIHTSNYIPYTKCMGTVNTVQKKTNCKLIWTCCNKLSFESLNQFLPHAYTAKRWGSHFVAAAVVILGCGCSGQFRKNTREFLHRTEWESIFVFINYPPLPKVPRTPQDIAGCKSGTGLLSMDPNKSGLLNIYRPKHAHM
jgi:hypothetical protein